MGEDEYDLEDDVDRRLDAWMSVLRTQSRMVDLLEADLRRRLGLTIPRFDVLAQLDRKGGRARFQRLADAILLSRSGLSRLLDRMERDGLIAREDDPADARGQIVALTQAGADILEKARLSHHANVRRWFTDRLEAGEAEVITRALRRVRLGLPGGPESEAAMVWGAVRATREGSGATGEPAGPGDEAPGG